MTNLIKADLYKETKKKSYKIILLLTILISLLYIYLVKDKDFSLASYNIKLTKEEYKQINKHGDYNTYLTKYNLYKDNYTDTYYINLIEKDNTFINIITSSTSLYFIIGIFLVYITYTNISNDYNYKTLKYLFQSQDGRIKILLSKIISITIISISLILLTYLTTIILTSIITKTNPLLIDKTLYINNKFIKLPITTYYFIKGLIYLIPITFMNILTIFLSILTKGNVLGVIISIVVYITSTTINTLLLNKGILILSNTPIPYLDLTYFENTEYYLLNAIYNTSYTVSHGLTIITIYTIILLLINIILYKKTES